MLTGTEYRKLIARYVATTYQARGIEVYEEVNAGTTIIGKQRRLDLLVLSAQNNCALALECKYQDSTGTVDEKIPYALDDLHALPMPGVIVYAGRGFSEGVLHLLQSSSLAAFCFPREDCFVPSPRRRDDPLDSGTWQLDHVLAMSFHWWDLLVSGKQPFDISHKVTEPLPLIEEEESS